MDPLSPQARNQKMRQVAVMLSGSFFFMVAMLGLTLHNVTRAREMKVPLADALKHPLALPLVGAGALTAVMSFVLKRLLSPKVDSSQTLRDRFINSQNETDPVRTSRYFAAHVLSYALSESVAIFGFVLGLSSGSFEVALPFFAAALVLFALHWPRTDSWK